MYNNGHTETDVKVLFQRNLIYFWIPLWKIFLDGTKTSCFILGRFETGELHTLRLQLRETSQSKQIPFSHYKGF